MLAIALFVAALSFDVGGVSRQAELFVPEGVGASAPLVVVLHGRTGSAQQVRQSSGFDEVARRHGFVVAYPDGIDHRWRDLRQLTLAPTTAFGPADVEFLLALVDRIQQAHATDPRRVFFAGHSNGAMMALTMACLHAAKIAAIAVVAGNLPRVECALSRPVPALFFHGTKDPLVKFDGGGVGPGGERGFVLSNDESVDVFARAAGCTGATRTQRATSSGAAVAVIVDERSGCRAPVKRFILDGGGHGWPGRGPIWTRNTRDLDASAEIGAFFASLSQSALSKSALSKSAPPSQ